jgi:hypothetical protein
MSFTIKPFALLQNDLRLLFTDEARESIVSIVDPPAVYQKKLKKDPLELISYLKAAQILTEENVVPLIQITLANPDDLYLKAIRQKLEKYQVQKEIETTSQVDLLERFNNPQEKDVLFSLISQRQEDKQEVAFSVESNLKARYTPVEDRLEFYEITQPLIKNNATGICIICKKQVCNLMPICITTDQLGTQEE